MELVCRWQRPTDGRLMGRPTHVYTIGYVAVLNGRPAKIISGVAYAGWIRRYRHKETPSRSVISCRR
ncbi:hypothetical protein AGR7A_Lc10269 [Agrobacterium deltaense NCPPB 1641]|uniref:Uncharacterized protein n=1 Tax=Agrobacterium deltaense NCPPB 1641 TaxID=1183425 RepID=A0A1S7TSJ0_9HYPH|nr:hypothetical protein AGR7A_Lc10269 [Agrobacterium deltaense NCPPB 1641]